MELRTSLYPLIFSCLTLSGCGSESSKSDTQEHLPNDYINDEASTNSEIPEEVDTQSSEPSNSDNLLNDPTSPHVGTNNDNTGTSGMDEAQSQDQTKPDSQDSSLTNDEPDYGTLPGGWELVWNDEFSGDIINAEKWSHEVNGNGGGNNELQYYTNRQENSRIEDGRLIIEAKEEVFTGSDGTRRYTSARLRTLNKGDFLYGRIEVKAKLPQGQGLWPAIWMLPTDWVYGGWAASGEIDIMEAVNSQAAGGNTIHGTLHYGDKWPGNVHSGAPYESAKNVSEVEHVYAVEWEPHEIRWYVDGEHYSTQTQWWSSAAAYPAPFNQKFHIILNVAVGGNWPGSPNASTVFPQKMEVDYVRVYQRDDMVNDGNSGSINAFSQIEAEQAHVIHGAFTAKTGGRGIINYFTTGDYLKFENVDFSDGAESVSLVLAQDHVDANIEIRIDALDGPVIADMALARTGGWGIFQQQSFDLNQKVTGTHDIYVVAKHDFGAGDVDYLKFSKTPSDEVNSGSDGILKAMSLNIYGHATMPAGAEAYADLINQNGIDVLAIQEGVQDWRIQGLPTDYSRSEQLQAALGDCWQRRYQIFVNSCQNNSFVNNDRFDMTDGPNAVRTGEWAVIRKGTTQFNVLNLHWDHEDQNVRLNNSNETIAMVQDLAAIPTIVMGDFNTGCTSSPVNNLRSSGNLMLKVNGGIDCILTNGFEGEGYTVAAAPSDHPGLISVLRVE